MLYGGYLHGRRWTTVYNNGRLYSVQFSELLYLSIGISKAISRLCSGQCSTAAIINIAYVQGNHALRVVLVRQRPAMHPTHIRRFLHDVLLVACSIANILMAWKGLCAITASTHPILVVTSESMEPAFSRGDLIILWNRRVHVHAGDIPVVWFPGRPSPMVHRVISVSHQVIGQDSVPRCAQPREHARVPPQLC